MTRPPGVCNMRMRRVATWREWIEVVILAVDVLWRGGTARGRAVFPPADDYGRRRPDTLEYLGRRFTVGLAATSVVARYCTFTDSTEPRNGERAPLSHSRRLGCWKDCGRPGFGRSALRPALTTAAAGSSVASTCSSHLPWVTDGISAPWDFSLYRGGGAGLIEGHTGQTVIREIVQDYLRYVGF